MANTLGLKHRDFIKTCNFAQFLALESDRILIPRELNLFSSDGDVSESKSSNEMLFVAKYFAGLGLNPQSTSSCKISVSHSSLDCEEKISFK